MMSARTWVSSSGQYTGAPVAPEPAERAAELQAGERVTEAGRRDVRRRRPGELIEEPAENTDSAVEHRVGGGIHA